MDVPLPATRREILTLSVEVSLLDFVIHAKGVQVLGDSNADRTRRREPMNTHSYLTKLIPHSIKEGPIFLIKDHLKIK